MAALYLLTNLSSPAARLWALEQPKSVRDRPLLATAIQLAAVAAEKNYIRFLRLLHSGRLPSPYRPAARRSTGDLAAGCIQVMSVAYSSPACRYPLDHLASLLYMSPEALRLHCDAVGVKILNAGDKESACIQFSKASIFPPHEHGLVRLEDCYLLAGSELSGDMLRSFILGSS
jgi:hypothetical protein